MDYRQQNLQDSRGKLGQVSYKTKELLDQTVQINPGDIVIDCGANIGTVTDYFINRGAEVYAF